MEILSRLREAPKQNRAITSCQTSVTNPSTLSIPLKASAPVNMMLLLLKRCSSMPVMGMVNIRPKGSANNTLPSSASFR